MRRRRWSADYSYPSAPVHSAAWLTSPKWGRLVIASFNAGADGAGPECGVYDEKDMPMPVYVGLKTHFV
jgi:hypothetical protein